MPVTTQQVLRLLWRSPSFLDSTRFFSTNEEREKQALLRALRSDGRVNTRRKVPEKSSSNSPGRRPRWGKDGEKLTFAEFFEHMGKRETRRSRARKAQAEHESAMASAIGISNIEREDDEATLAFPNKPPSDMMSFFDEVNAIVDRKKKESSDNNKSDRDQPSFSVQDDEKDEYGRMPVAGLFAALKEKKPRSPDAFDEESFDKYLDLLDIVMESDRFAKSRKKRITEEQIQQVRDWLLAEEPVVRVDLRGARHDIFPRDTPCCRIYRVILTRRKFCSTAPFSHNFQIST